MLGLKAGCSVFQCKL